MVSLVNRLKTSLSQRLALIDDTCGRLNVSNKKMGRQMVSISFKTAIEKYGDSSLYLLPPEIPSII